MSSPRVAVLVMTLAALTVSGCTASDQPRPSASAAPSSSPGAPSPSSSAATGPRYVALGDSFTAGPGITPIVRDSGLCIRSRENYAQLVARAVNAAQFTDVSCAGATTDDVLKARFLPAQLAAVSAATRLVTVGIGGNDEGLFSRLSSSCSTGAAPCRAYVRDTLPGVLSATTDRVARVLTAIHRKAPRATVLLVGYLSIAPATGSCSALGGDAFDTADVASAQRSLDTALATAARRTGTRFVSLQTASRGHEACAGTDAWVNGRQPSDANDGIALHPRRAGMQAVARAVKRALAQ